MELQDFMYGMCKRSPSSFEPAIIANALNDALFDTPPKEKLTPELLERIERVIQTAQKKIHRLCHTKKHHEFFDASYCRRFDMFCKGALQIYIGAIRNRLLTSTQPHASESTRPIQRGRGSRRGTGTKASQRLKNRPVQGQ